MPVRRPALSVATRALVALVAILLLFPLAPWPRLQLALHAAIVVALCVDPRDYLVTALLAALSGWAVEGSLKLLPRLGGTPWAALTTALLAAFLAEHWPAETRWNWILRCAGLTVVLLLLTHLMVRWAAGPHGFGQGWSLVFLTLPLWAWQSWRLHEHRA
jgi:hypothetical protein